MKKTTVKILSCLIAVMVVTGCVGCGKKPPTVPEINDITLVNFETWEPDFQLCRISSAFGKISINTDKQYVKTGERSARIDPVGDGWMYYPTYSELYEFDYTDFSYINSVRVEMYNAQEEDKTVHVGLVTELMGIDRFNQANEESFLLKPGWNTIDLLVDPNIICMIADITEIQGVYFKYERLDRHSVTEDTPRYYIDSITLKKRDTPHSTQSNIEFGENEIMDFEQFYHKYFLINDFDVDMEIVKAVDYGISAPSGTKVLRLVAPGMASGSWRYYFKLMAPVLKMSALGNLTDEQFENAYFCWDAYNNSSAEFNIVAVFEVGSGGKDYRVGTYPKPGQWTTFRIKLTDIVSGGADGWKENMGMFVFSIKDDSDIDRELFFDNFRVEMDSADVK